PVVVGGAEAAVDVRRGEDERPPPAEGRDLLDRGCALVRLELAHAGETIEVNPEPVPTVELHVVSDATGETASRVVTAVEAQFPDQPFVTVRHPRVETVADLQLALARMQGRPAVAIFTVVEPTLREAMRELCREAD